VLPVSISHIFSFPYGHLLAAYVFSLAFSSLLYFIQYRILEQLRQMCLIQLAFFLVLMYIKCFLLSWPYVTLILFHTIGATDLINPAPAPHFRTFKVLLVYVLKYANIYKTFLKLRKLVRNELLNCLSENCLFI